MKNFLQLKLLIISLIGPLILLFVFNANAQQITQPNIILITADDLGFDDLSIHGNPVIETPNLDALAKRSVQFSDYNVSPVCATTRAALLTGRHYYKTGVSGVHGGRDYLSLDETLISNVLQENGYATGTWGKWHIGKTAGYLPQDRGFDESYYAQLYVHENSYGYINQQKVEHDDWVSSVVTDYAIDFIDRQKNNKPFFAYLSYLAPHEPWVAPKKYVDKYKAKGQRDAIANLYGMIEEMDHHIGRLINHIDQQGLADNTIIIFMSDNGPWFGSSNYGAMHQHEWEQRNPNNWHGMKGRNWQNGVKSPLFIRYGDHYQPRTIAPFTFVTDIMPYLLEVTNIQLNKNHKPIDGESFKRALEGDTTYARQKPVLIGSHDVISHKALFNQWTPFDDVAKNALDYNSQMLALRDDRYKLILNPVKDESHYPDATEQYVLFDMKTDPQETKNLFLAKPTLAAIMLTKMQTAYQDVFNDADSFKTPMYQISGDISAFNAFGPASTQGNVKSQAHLLGGFKQAGDSATYDLQINEAGIYDLWLNKQDHYGSGFEVKISVANKPYTTTLNEHALQKLAQIPLPQGAVTLKFEVTQNTAMTTWMTLNNLRRFYLIKQGTNKKPSDLSLPN
ncbi:sulfatase-like hydrolase/transferase [Algibacillus agarilyticus]|uniref:sulfatase-like hydrolase/transferase n=1 Tax=Algibacillus agarilyticus TaxID=2234133 RepID=UPI000DCFF84E|nr:sulfatase-like hydrolase/transferase [Algibacillus agarilyticus]